MPSISWYKFIQPVPKHWNHPAWNWRTYHQDKFRTLLNCFSTHFANFWNYNQPNTDLLITNYSAFCLCTHAFSSCFPCYLSSLFPWLQVAAGVDYQPSLVWTRSIKLALGFCLVHWDQTKHWNCKRTGQHVPRFPMKSFFFVWVYQTLCFLDVFGVILSIFFQRAFSWCSVEGASAVVARPENFFQSMHPSACDLRPHWPLVAIPRPAPVSFFVGDALFWLAVGKRKYRLWTCDLMRFDDLCRETILSTFGIREHL